MNQLLNKLKDKLSQKEYSTLCKALDNYKNDAPSFFKVCLESRISIAKAKDTLNVLRKDISSFLSLCEYVASVKTIYLTDRNARQTKECSYDVNGDTSLLKTALFTVTANAHIVSKILKEKNAFTLCKAIKLFNDLIFFALECNDDKSTYETYLKTTEDKLSSLKISTEFSLCPMYVSLYSLEKAEKLSFEFEKTFKAIKKVKNAGEVTFWSEKGLDVYGYNEQCEKLREWAIDRYMEGDKRFSSSLISEIIINN